MFKVHQTILLTSTAEKFKNSRVDCQKKINAKKTKAKDRCLNKRKVYRFYQEVTCIKF